LREQEAPPVRGTFVQLDNEDEDVLTAKKNTERSDGTKKKKEKLKKQAEVSSLRDKIDDMVNSKEHLVNKVGGKNRDDGEENPRESSKIEITPTR
jgi:hypothetical protein